MSYAVDVNDLEVAFGDLRAVDDVTLNVNVRRSRHVARSKRCG